MSRSGYKFPRGRNKGLRRGRLPTAQGVGLGDLVSCMRLTQAAEVSDPVVSPAISLPVSPANSREQLTTETQGSKRSNQSGSQSAVLGPNCYSCKFRATIPGDAHSECMHPVIQPHERLLTPMNIMMGAQQDPCMMRLGVSGHPHGIAKGWFLWPINFDPVWLRSCNGFEPK